MSWSKREELQSIAHNLRSAGYDAVTRVEIGHFDKILRGEAGSDKNDVLVLIKRRTLQGTLRKARRFRYSQCYLNIQVSS